MSLPPNWGEKKTFQDRENVSTNEAYDINFSKNENVEQQSGGI